ncbi:MAG: hypothetical protein U9R15_11740 [Chloroflexota bacterium]|nr:hypothetical protein [Chloroflexota bacterium]
MTLGAQSREEYESEHQVIPGGQLVIDGRFLRHQPHPPLDRVGVVGQVVAVDENAPLGWL